MRWGENGDTLVISDINMFSDKVLPVYFNHNNYSSFIRQLNMYGFRKENKEKKTKQEEYKHEFFKKSQPELLDCITRKKKQGDEEEKLRLMDDSRDESGEFLFSSFNMPLQIGMDLTMDDLKHISPEIIKDVQ